ncbi:MAG: hypothetical protein AB1599_10625, partial [Planctomycetota bacterium]
MRQVLYIISAIILFSPLCLWAYEPTEEEVIERLESPYLPDNNIKLAEAALVFSKSIYPRVDIKTNLERVEVVADEINKRLKSKGSNDPAQIIAEINRFFREKKIKAESVLTGLPTFLSESERDKF